MNEIGVFWMSRNLGIDLVNPGVANHHYILITLSDEVCNWGKFKVVSFRETKFMTLGGFSDGQNMVYRANDSNDTASMKEIIGRGLFARIINPFDWDTQKHSVRSPMGSNLQFAQKIVQLAENYERNTRANPFVYRLFWGNCASWVNTIFKIAGVSEQERRSKGQFIGIDAGENLVIPEKLFK